MVECFTAFDVRMAVLIGAGVGFLGGYALTIAGVLRPR